MKRGSWYQFGDRSQLMVIEQLKNKGSGVGVILSPRDLAPHLAIKYAQKYRTLGADVLIDQQFYIPSAMVGTLPKYGIAEYRNSASLMGRLNDSQLMGFAKELKTITEQVDAAAVIAPAVLYEAGRTDLVALNKTLFEVAKSVADDLGIPVYATVAISQSAASSNATLSTTLDAATSLDSDGWYFAFDFGAVRIPNQTDPVAKCIRAGLKLASTGKPVLHAFAGPLGILSPGFGATGVAVGHSQNLWHLTPSRWESSGGQGGGGDAPPRFFSDSLWGTIVYSDEVAPLPLELREKIIIHSSYSKGHVATTQPYTTWSRWDSNKHLIHMITARIDLITKSPTVRECAHAAILHLESAIDLHNQISDEGLLLNDDSASYQAVWVDTLSRILIEQADDYDFLDLM